MDRNNGETIKKLDADIKMIFSAMIVKTDDGLVWAGHDKGVSAFDSSFNEEIRLEAPEIPAGRVNTLYVDENGLWAGSQEGAAHLSRKNGKWEVDQVLTKDNGLSEKVVEVIEKVGDDYWFGSYMAEKDGGVSIREKDGWEYISIKDGIPHRFINAILPLSSDKVLIGSGQMIYGGLSMAVKKDGKWKISENWDQKDGLPGMKVRALFLDSEGRLWITTETDGLMIMDSPEKLSERPLSGNCIRKENGLSDDEIKCIVETENCFWLGSKYGLNRYDKTIDYAYRSERLYT